MKYLFVVILIVLSAPALALADNGAKLKSAEDLLELMKTEQSLADYISQYKQTMAGFIDKMDIHDVEKDREQKQYAKMIDFIEKEMSWKKMKPDFVKLYSEVFTADELSGMIDFYKSPIGKASIEKTPALTKKSMELVQAYVEKILPQIKELCDEANSGKDKNIIVNKGPETGDCEKVMSEKCVIAETEGVKITVGDYLKEKSMLPENLKELANSEDGKQQMLESMLLRELILKEALKEKVNEDMDVKKKTDDLSKKVLVEAYLKKHVKGTDKASQEKEFISIKSSIRSKYDFKISDKLNIVK